MFLKCWLAGLRFGEQSRVPLLAKYANCATYVSRQLHNHSSCKLSARHLFLHPTLLFYLSLCIKFNKKDSYKITYSFTWIHARWAASQTNMNSRRRRNFNIHERTLSLYIVILSYILICHLFSEFVKRLYCTLYQLLVLCMANCIIHLYDLDPHFSSLF